MVLPTAPTLYFFNLIFGSDQSLSQNLALMLTAITVTMVDCSYLRSLTAGETIPPGRGPAPEP